MACARRQDDREKGVWRPTAQCPRMTREQFNALSTEDKNQEVKLFSCAKSGQAAESTAQSAEGAQSGPLNRSELWPAATRRPGPALKPGRTLSPTSARQTDVRGAARQHCTSSPSPEALIIFCHAGNALHRNRRRAQRSVRAAANQSHPSAALARRDQCYSPVQCWSCSKHSA